MPDIGAFHPQLVHFVVALGIVGVLFRLASFTPWAAWSGPAATALLVMAAGAGVIAAEAGDQAHGAVERIPGAREAVEEHEEAGENARNVLLAVAALELAALALGRRAKLQKGLRMASGLVGLGALFAIFEAGEHGGEVVYGYAGGVGTRSGDSADVRHLLVAGLYNQAALMRKAGRADEAARLTDELMIQSPGDPAVELLAAESELKDRKDPAGALAALAAIVPPADDRGLTIRVGLLRSEAYTAAGHPDSARAVLEALKAKFPDSRWVAEALKGTH